jgi:hypothetical protein
MGLGHVAVSSHKARMGEESCVHMWQGNLKEKDYFEDRGLEGNKIN